MQGPALQTLGALIVSNPHYLMLVILHCYIMIHSISKTKAHYSTTLGIYITIVSQHTFHMPLVHKP